MKEESLFDSIPKNKKNFHMTISLRFHVPIPFASSMKIHRVKVVMAMKVEIQSTKLIKPSVLTPSALRRCKLSIIDELAPEMNLPLVLFFPPNVDYSLEPIAQLEESLKETLTLFYPFAGRYMENISTVDCHDQGVEFIQARADITIKEILDHKMDPHTVNQLSPSKLLASDVTNAMLATQVTMFQCGGLALGVSIAHRIGDASTMNSFLNQWATLSRKDIKVDSCGTDFTSSSLFPAQGLPSIEVGFAKLPINDEYVTKRFSFNFSGISNMKAKVMHNGDGNTRQLFKVQLVSALIWKTIIDVDYAIYGHPRDSILLQPLALRRKGEKIASMKAKISLGNHWGPIVSRCDATKTVKKLEELIDMLSDSVKKTIRNYAKVGHDSNERKEMVLKSFSHVTDIPDTTNVIWIVSWCKFPFYDVDFGFGKPIWVSSGGLPFKRGMFLLDDAEGDGVEACVTMGVKDVAYFEQDEDIKAFSV